MLKLEHPSWGKVITKQPARDLKTWTNGDRMGTIASYTVEELKELGFSSADIEYVLEMTSVYTDSLKREPMEANKIAIAKSAFEAGVIVGVAKVRKLQKKLTKIGF